MNTIYLDTGTWDFAINSDGNIAAAATPYALAQDAASYCRTFLGEVYYNTGIGIPYQQQILAQSPPLQIVRNALVTAALEVPEVIAARVFFSSFDKRVLTGQVQITDNTGVVTALGF
jgi:hypothetical protein